MEHSATHLKTSPNMCKASMYLLLILLEIAALGLLPVMDVISREDDGVALMFRYRRDM